MDIFAALADPNRRELILQLDSRGPLSIKQLSCDTNISRQANTKHVNILLESKLVSAEFIGKQRIHPLDTQPIQKLADWLQPFALQWEQRLNDLCQHLGEVHE